MADETVTIPVSIRVELSQDVYQAVLDFVVANYPLAEDPSQTDFDAAYRDIFIDGCMNIRYPGVASWPKGTRRP